MNRFLLDTQILIWALGNNPKLKAHLRNIIESPLNEILVNQLSLIEISIKLKIGKLPEFIADNELITNQFLADGYKILPISNNHIFAYQSIPLFENHRDPFDRLLLATSLSEKIPILTADGKFNQYQPYIEVIR